MLVTLLGIVTLVRLAADRERTVPDAGDAVGDRDVGQAGAAIERTVPDAGDAVGDRDAGQAWSNNRTHMSPMLVTLLPIVTLVRLVQSENAESPMLVTLLGIVTLVRLEQPENAESPMLVTLLPIVMLVRLVQ